MEGGIFSSLFVPPIERKRKGDSMNRYQLLDKENLQFISEEEFISDFLIKDCEVKNIEEKIFISNCIVENVVFTECNLDKIDIYKTKFIHCDMSNINMSNAVLNECFFVNCKMMGTNISSSSMNNIVYFTTYK